MIVFIMDKYPIFKMNLNKTICYMEHDVTFFVRFQSLYTDHHGKIRYANGVFEQNADYININFYRDIKTVCNKDSRNHFLFKYNKSNGLLDGFYLVSDIGENYPNEYYSKLFDLNIKFISNNGSSPSITNWIEYKNRQCIIENIISNG